MSNHPISPYHQDLHHPRPLHVFQSVEHGLLYRVHCLDAKSASFRDSSSCLIVAFTLSTFQITQTLLYPGYICFHLFQAICNRCKLFAEAVHYFIHLLSSRFERLERYLVVEAIK